MTPAQPPSGPLSPRAARLALELETWERRTVTLDELWALLHRADPASAGRATRRDDLAAAVDELAAAELVTLPGRRSFDTTAHPPLPRRISLPAVAPGPSAAALARSVAWRPELAWAVSARLTVGQVELLRRVNTWLRDHADAPPAPLRERALEVLGHEKALDRLLGTGLFEPGRLTLDLLRAYRARPPLPARRVGAGPVLLVAENSDTFDTLHRLLTAEPGRVGWVAWGAGGAFEASVASTRDLDGVAETRYFGDLDADGLRIPHNAATHAAADGLPPVRPATGLYRLLLASQTRQDQQPPLTRETATQLTTWLPADLRPAASHLLTSGVRIPQEAAGIRILAATRAWRETLE